MSMASPSTKRKPILLALAASFLLTVLIIAGSRNLEHYDAALFGYTVASVVHVFGNQKVETRVYLMLPTDADEVEIDGCGVFEGTLTAADATVPTSESWIDTQVEVTDKSNEF